MFKLIINIYNDLFENYLKFKLIINLIFIMSVLYKHLFKK